MEDYKVIATEDVELSEEEINTALNNAKRIKAGKINEISYLKQLSKPLIYPEVSTNKLANIILEHAKSIIPEFVLDDHARDIFKLLCQYFTNNSEFEKSGYSLKKGLFLFGNIGCGKTTMMRLFQRNVTNDFYVISCRQVADEYTKFGADTLEKYSVLKEVYPHEHYGQKVQGICFDDLGTEKNKKYFGNEINVMEDIFQNRYDKRLIGKTHLTSNLSGEEIDEMYGPRVRSRLREMCNVIQFSKDAPDRR